MDGFTFMPQLSTNRTVFLFATASTLLMPSMAAAQDTEAGSFASAFFISTSANASGESYVEWLGSIIIWLLIAGSVASIGLMGTLYMKTNPERILPLETKTQARKLIKGGRYREALTLLADDESDFAKVLHAALARASGGFGAMQRGLEMAAGEVVATRSRHVEILNVIGQVSPMIGLFGTVYGMILAFQSIVASGGNADPVLLAGGIGTALVTTFWGLIVAIPALSGYATIRAKLDGAQAEAISEAVDIIEGFRADGGKRRSSSTRTDKKQKKDQPEGA